MTDDTSKTGADIALDDKDLRDAKSEVKEIQEKISLRWNQGDYGSMETRLNELKELMSAPDFWDDQDKAKQVLGEEKKLKDQYEPWLELKRKVSDWLELFDMAREEGDQASLTEAIGEITELKSEFSRIESLALLVDEDDKSNAYLTIHPGAGGTESQDWAEMLMRMFMRWAEAKGYRLQTIDLSPGEQAGIKSAIILVSGENVSGFLKSEIGVHRLVRISPFDSNKRRHTSFASVYVTPEIDDDFELEVNEEDLRIDTYRSSGAGGQHVNTTDSAVRITHIPTGLVAQCQNERSQHKNKAQAMKVLKSQIYQYEKEKREAEAREKQPEKKDIAWGSQIRSYVFHPYNMVKDHRTNYETGNINAMMDGELLDDFIYAYLQAKSLGQL